MAAAAPWSPPDLGPFPPEALWNALVSHLGQRLPLRAPAFAVVSAGREPAAEAVACRMAFGAGAEFVAALAAFPFAAAVGAAIGAEDLPLLPPALRDALFDGAAASLAGLLPPHRDGPPAVAARGTWAELDTGTLERARLRWFRAEMGGFAPEPAGVNLGVDPRDIERLLPPMPGRRLWDGLAARLTAPVHDTLGRLDIAAADLGRLAPGLVVVLDRAFDDGRRHLRAGGLDYLFAREGGGWRCAAAAPHGHPEPGVDAPMPTDDTREPAGGLDIGRIAVAVDFDLGRIDVPLGEVEGWQPGSLVALPPSVLADGVAVTLRVNGRAVGSGDLVRVDDRVAVRLTALRLG